MDAQGEPMKRLEDIERLHLLGGLAHLVEQLKRAGKRLARNETQFNRLSQVCDSLSELGYHNMTGDCPGEAKRQPEQPMQPTHQHHRLHLPIEEPMELVP